MTHNQDNTFIHRQFCDGYFTTIYNSCLETNQLSLAAKGLLCYILSRPKNFRINLQQLADVLHTPGKRGSGIDSIKGCMNELKKAEYVLYSKTRNERGHWEHHYHFYPLPFSIFQKMFPEVVKPAVVEPAVVKPPLITNKEITNKECFVCAPSSPEKKIVSVEEKVEAPEAEISDHTKITKQGFKKTHSISKNDVLLYAVQKQKTWSEEDIDKAWSVLVAYSDPIRDVYAFIEGTIKNNKKLAGLKSYDEKIQNTYGTKSNAPRSSQNKKDKESHKEDDKSPQKPNDEEIERLRKEEIEKIIERNLKQRREEEMARNAQKTKAEFIPTDSQQQEIIRICKKRYEELTSDQKNRMRQYFEC